MPFSFHRWPLLFGPTHQTPPHLAGCCYLNCSVTQDLIRGGMVGWFLLDNEAEAGFTKDHGTVPYDIDLRR